MCEKKKIHSISKETNRYKCCIIYFKTFIKRKGKKNKLWTFSANMAYGKMKINLIEKTVLTINRSSFQAGNMV